MKILTSLFSLLIIFSCSIDKIVKTINNEKQNIPNDTIVKKNPRKIETKNNFLFKTMKEVEYFVSINNKESNLKYTFSKRNDGKVVVSRKDHFRNMPQQKSVFDFGELKYVLKEAKKDFEISKLDYLIYGALDSEKDLNSVEKITKKHIEINRGNSNISTKNYEEISELILQSDIVSQINNDLSFYEKKVAENSIEKAHISKPDLRSTELLNAFVVMKIANK